LGSNPLITFLPVGRLAGRQPSLASGDLPGIEQRIGSSFWDMPMVADAVSQAGSLRVVDSLASQVHRRRE